MAIALAWSMTLCQPCPHDADAAPALPVESEADYDARMAWWREARFGMFIHWGVYAIPAGEWKGKKHERIAEWIMDTAEIPVDEYKELANQFNPDAYDPSAWAEAAHDAGIKYVVITSKHHDGFCLFDTNETDWDVVDSTPYGKDLLKPLAEELRKRGIRFCVYYSIMDWSHPSQVRGGGHGTGMRDGKKQEYVGFMKRQLSELLESCGPDVIWFDGEWPDWWTEEDGEDLYAYLRRLKPSLIVNNRVGKGRQGMSGLDRQDRDYAGDFGTPEQEIPDTGAPGADWESCMTMNTSWGYKHFDHQWKSPKQLIHNLVDIASKGGNFLLNVGPKADGAFPTESVERLQAIGRWIDKNGESIYGAQASPFERPSWGRFTVRHSPTGSVLYAHVFDPPAGNEIEFPNTGRRVESARLLSTGESLDFVANGAKTIVRLPADSRGDIDTVVSIRLGEKP